MFGGRAITDSIKHKINPTGTAKHINRLNDITKISRRTQLYLEMLGNPHLEKTLDSIKFGKSMDELIRNIDH